MRSIHGVVGATLLVLTSGCTIIDEILAEDACGGNATMVEARSFQTPSVLATEGDFYTAIEGEERVLRYSTYFTGVCSEEHAEVAFEAYCDRNLAPSCRAVADYSTYVLFGRDVEMTPNALGFAATTDVGLKQHWEGQAGEFSAGITVWIPASIPEAEVATAIPGFAIRGQYRLSPVQ